MDESGSYLHWETAPRSAVQILRRAHDLVAFGWCQGADATDAHHDPVEPWSARACYWSLLGALAAVLGPPQEDVAESPELIAELRVALVALSDSIPDSSLQRWNDDRERTQAGVVATLATAHQHCGSTTADKRARPPHR